MVKNYIQATFGTTTYTQDLASLMLPVSLPLQVVLYPSMFWPLALKTSFLSMTGRVTVVGELWGRRRVIPGNVIPPSPRDPSFIRLNCLERLSLK